MKTFNFVVFTLFVLGIGATLAADNETEVLTTLGMKFDETTISTTLDPNITTTVSPNSTTTTSTTPLTTSSTTVSPNSTTTTTSTTTPSTTTISTSSTSTTPSTTTPNATTSTTTTTTVAPSTTTPNATTILPPTTTSSPHPAPIPHPSKWSLTSFIGGIVFGLGMIAIGFVAWKFYKARNERNYHTL